MQKMQNISWLFRLLKARIKYFGYYTYIFLPRLARPEKLLRNSAVLLLLVSRDCNCTLRDLNQDVNTELYFTATTNPQYETVSRITG